ARRRHWRARAPERLRRSRPKRPQANARADRAHAGWFSLLSIPSRPLPAGLADGLARLRVLQARYGRITGRFAPAAQWCGSGSPARREREAPVRREPIERLFVRLRLPYPQAG